MKNILILIFVFIYPLSLISDDCSCSAAPQGMHLVEKVFLNSNFTEDTYSSCSGTGCPSAPPLPPSYTSECPEITNPGALYKFIHSYYTYDDNPDFAFRIIHHNEETSFMCTYEDDPVCEEPDKTYQIDASLWEMSDLPQKNGCSQDDPYDINSECDAIGGSVFAVSRFKCCTTTACFLPVNDCLANQIFLNNTCIDCPQNSYVNGNLCACNSGYYQSGDTCLEHLCPYGEYYSLTTEQCEIHDCPPNQVPTDTYETDGSCKDLDDSGSDSNSSNCDYPSSKFGYPFQTLTHTSSYCNILSGGNLLYQTEFMPDCLPDQYACYYNNHDDNNQTDDAGDGGNDSNGTGTGDNNSTGGDNNNSGVFDDTEILNRLDTLISLDKINNDNLDTINSSILSSALGTQDHIDSMNDNLGTKLDALKNSNIDSAIGIKNAISSMNTNLGVKLQGIESSIDGISDILTTNDGISFTPLPTATDNVIQVDEDKINTIKSKVLDLNLDIETINELLSTVKTEFNIFYDHLVSIFETLQEDYSTFKDMFSDIPTTILSGGGGCSHTFTVFGTTVDLMSNVCDILQKLSPVFVFLVTIVTQLSLIMISMRLLKKD